MCGWHQAQRAWRVAHLDSLYLSGSFAAETRHAFGQQTGEQRGLETIAACPRLVNLVSKMPERREVDLFVLATRP